jgi:hypothetical protein
MWADLEAGRATEVDYLQGEILALAERLGRDAPVNRAIAALVHAAERGGRRDYGGDELRAALRSVRGFGQTAHSATPAAARHEASSSASRKRP